MSIISLLLYIILPILNDFNKKKYIKINYLGNSFEIFSLELVWGYKTFAYEFLDNELIINKINFL